MQYKNVLIIGASQGIGEALVLEFANFGYNLCLLSRNNEAIKKLSDKLNSENKKCFYKSCDISVYEEVKSGIEFANSSLGSIDIAIINAGVGHPEWMKTFSSEGYKKLMQINAFGIAHSLEFFI